MALHPAGVLPIALLLASSTLVGCGDDSSGPGAATSGGSTRGTDDPGLTFTRDDGSTFGLSDFGVRCRRSTVNDRAQVVQVTSPADLAGRSSANPYFFAELAPGTTGEVPLPLEGGVNFFFAYDPQEQNELNGDQDEASGTLTVLEATCDPVPRLSVTIDGSLGSEYGDLPGIDVEGAAAGEGS